MKEAKNKQYFEATGYSMWPFLRKPDRIIVEQTGCGSLTSGDLVVYKSGDKSICHRLVRKRIFAGKYSLLTRGDYVSSWEAEKVEEAQVMGRVLAIVRGGRIVSLQGVWPMICGKAIILFFPLVARIFAGLQKIIRKQ